jgi:hypothetical protein
MPMSSDLKAASANEGGAIDAVMYVGANRYPIAPLILMLIGAANVQPIATTCSIADKTGRVIAGQI